MWKLARGKAQISKLTTEEWFKILKARSRKSFRFPEDFESNDELEYEMRKREREDGYKEW